MESEFHMSIMGELTFFLGIQVKQTKQGTFVHQAKYTKDLMKKFNMTELKPVSTPMSSAALLSPDEDAEVVDQREYRSMIGSLLYLKATRPNIQVAMTELKPVSTPMSSAASLSPDEDGEAVDQREYRSMIGSLLYLIATRPDIQFAMGLCVRFQASPYSSHQTAIQ
jgi:hypothetical protein